MSEIPANHLNGSPFKGSLLFAMCKDMYERKNVHIPALIINNCFCKLSIPKDTLTEKVSKLAVNDKISKGIDKRSRLFVDKMSCKPIQKSKILDIKLAHCINICNIQ